MSARPDPGAWAWLAILVIAWGSSFLLTAIALRDLDPFFTAGARIALAAAAMTVVAVAIEGPLPREPRFWLWSVPIGFFGLAASYGAYSWAQLEAPSGVVAIYVSASPIFTVILARIFTDERTTRRGILGFLLGFAGVALVIGPANIAALGGPHFAYEIAALAAGISFAAGGVAIRAAPRWPPLQSAAGGLIVATLIALPFVIATAPEAAPGPSALSALIALGLFQTGLAQFARFRLIKRTGALFTAQASYLMPLWALLMGWLFLDERLACADAAGLALILAGAALIHRAGRRTR